MSFVERQIDVTLQYYQSGKSMLLTGHRVWLMRQSLAGVGGGLCSLRIFGLPLDVINEFLAVGPVNSKAITRNKILVQAGDKGKPLNTIFNGAILQAWGDFSNPPDVSLVIDAHVQAEAALTVAPPVSWKGSVPVATIMQQFAAAGGWAFVNKGVTGNLLNPVFNGSLKDQIADCAHQAGIKYTFTADGHGLVICPPNIQPPGKGESIGPILSPGAGLVGYPAFTQQGISARAIFLPGMYYGMPFTIEGSELPMANRTWGAETVTHLLDSQTPGGPWFTDLTGFANE